MLKKILIVVAVLLAMLLLVGLVLPQHYRSARRVVVDATPAEVHALAGELKRWEEWSPWRGSDAALAVTLGGQTTGIGASLSWKHESDEGRLILTRCDPEAGITGDIDIVRGAVEIPMRSWLRYEPVGNGTMVEWGVDGEMGRPLLGGYCALLAGARLGARLDQGLDRLKRGVEGR